MRFGHVVLVNLLGSSFAWSTGAGVLPYLGPSRFKLARQVEQLRDRERYGRDMRELGVCLSPPTRFASEQDQRYVATWTDICGPLPPGHPSVDDDGVDQKG